MKIKRILTLCLALTLLLGVMAVPASAVDETTRFSDVKPGDWYYEAVMALADSGILSGYADGTFRPNDTVTCGELATILCRAFGLDTGSVYFRDDGTSVVREKEHAGHDDTTVNAGHWAEGAMQQMSVWDTYGTWAVCKANMPLNRGWAIDHLTDKILAATWPDGTKLDSPELSAKVDEMLGKIPDVTVGDSWNGFYNKEDPDQSHYANYRLTLVEPFDLVKTGEELIAHDYMVSAYDTSPAADDLASWNPRRIALGYAAGLTHGVDSTGRCDPWAPITRAQIVQILYNAGITYAGQLTYPDYSGKGGLQYGFGS